LNSNEAVQLFKSSINLKRSSCQQVDVQPYELTENGIMRKANHAELAELVGRAIARQRLRKGLTQEEVAERLGIGSEAVSRVERGIVIPNIARLFEFASVFECEAAVLLSEASSRSDDQAAHINRLLAVMNQADRQLVVEIVERLSGRLSHRDPT